MVQKIVAAVAVREKQTELREFDVPDIPPDAGLLKVEIAGVCGTDVSYYKMIKEPKILGHHVVGHIERIGEIAAKRWGVKKGDRVAMEEYIPCGQCEHCRKGQYRSCLFTDPRAGGIRYGATPVTLSPSLWGGFSQYMYLHPNAVMHKMPDHVPAVEAALTLPLANGFEWMSIVGKVGPGKVVVIQGPGQQGLACALAAKAAGAECVIVTGRTTSARRLELARELGADYTVNIQTEDLKECVYEITGGKMADVVIDVTSGGSDPVQSSMEAANKGATVIFGSYKYQTISDFNIDMVVAKTLNLKGVRGHSYESVKMAIEFIASGKFPLRKMNSHDYPLHDTDKALKTAGGEGEPSPLLVTVSPWKR
ncbi:zinc-dependent alcohol dehydrogenase [Effusibacillus lacus]|uniref:Alcohol dehydrogenase n=1 Tax=Effusibacillus lacus TaxID=1348429 RepID=A0A292YPH3_9BACL|nr:zinc-binding dehydrogenase [Effusibacillus lacus]TCS76604.1 threonine dehydrogenase-like Zn-dependent dehydrogenase [Effusibacillus lacus]GAX90380.1 alcohol dehydrogenase [Effusibacillus lacus]